MYVLLFALFSIAPAYAQQTFKKQKTTHSAQIALDDIALRPGSELLPLFNEQATQQLLDAIAEDAVKKADDALQQNANPNALYEPRTTSDGCAVPLLHTAIRKGHTEIVKLLVRAPGIRLNEIPQWDRANELERRGLVSEFTYDYMEQYFTPLTLAACCGRYAYSNNIPSRETFNEMVTILLAAGADVEINDGCTPLMRACQVGATPIVDQLLKKGPNFNAVSSMNETALKFAIEALSEECVDLLLQAGAEVNDTHFIDAFEALKEQRKSVYARHGVINLNAQLVVNKQEKLLWSIIKNLVRYVSKEPQLPYMSQDFTQQFAAIRNEVDLEKRSRVGIALQSYLPDVLAPIVQEYFFRTDEEQVAATLNDVISEVEYRVNAMEDEVVTSTALMISNNNH